MKNYIKILTSFIFFVFLGLQIFAQEEKTPSYFTVKDNSISNKDIVNVLDNDYYRPKLQESTINSVYLSQIGDKNIVDVDSKSGSSQTILQEGNSNFYLFKDSYLDPTVKFGVKQTGNENTLKIHGTNSSMNNTTFSQFGGAKVTINYYKY